MQVVGDLAQFMVANKLSAADVRHQAADPDAALNLPTSAVEFLQGQLGQPTGGFPEPLRAQVLRKANLTALDTRPGAELPPLDFDALKAELAAAYGDLSKDGFALRLDQDALSAALYPQVQHTTNTEGPPQLQQHRKQQNWKAWLAFPSFFFLQTFFPLRFLYPCGFPQPFQYLYLESLA